MLEIMQTALSGMRKAEDRVFQAARDIAEVRLVDAGVSASTPTGATSSVVTPSGAAQNPVTGGPGYSTYGQGDLATDFVQMMIAETAYKANAAVFRTADDMYKHLVDSKA